MCLIPSVFLFGFSFGVVDVLEVAIIFDRQTQRLEWDKAWTPGRYWTGLGRRFVAYPSTVQTLRFGHFGWFTEDPARGDAIECRSYDGMQLFMEVTVQYKLSQDPDDLVRLYRDFGKPMEGINAFYSDVAEKVIRDVAATYRSTQFFTKRAQLEIDMQVALDEDLRRVYASCESIQLMNMEFDKRGSFATAIETTQIAAQQVLEKINEVEVAKVTAEATRRSAETTSEVQVLLAESVYNATIKQAQADAEALLYKTEQQVAAYLKLKNDLGLANNTELLAYLWLKSVQNGASQVVMGTPYPSAILA